MIDIDSRVLERFWSLVIAPENADACWEWSGTRGKNGYAAMRVGRKRVYAHRISYVIQHGGIPDGLWVLHHCDNRPCCNPAHLYAGTPSNNAQDRERRDRGHRRKLNEQSVIEIRRIYAAGGTLQTEIARQFGVSHDLISQVVRRQAWRHVQEPSR
jgi:hypothetical protein